MVKLYILCWIIHPDERSLKETMNKKYAIYIAAVIIIVSIISGAFILNNYNAGTNNTGTQNLVIDDEDYSTTFTSVPQRIISLAPSNTQILFAIGVGERVVAVTDYDKYPYDFAAWIAAGNMTQHRGLLNTKQRNYRFTKPRLNSSNTHQRPRRCHATKLRLQSISAQSQ